MVEYDGSRYHGFQAQANVPTVQNEIENGIFKLTRERSPIIAASRTDAGVHALGQVVAFETKVSIPAGRWKRALNSVLPGDIRVLDSCKVDSAFHPRFQAIKKTYVYIVYRETYGKAFWRKYAWCNSDPLDIESMKMAALLFKGRQNFRSFCASGSSAKTYEREVKKCLIADCPPFITLTIEADGFLYNMVRIIMGTLIEVGKGKIAAHQIKDIISAQDRSLAGITAEPQGLYLVGVQYQGQEDIQPPEINVLKSGWLVDKEYKN
ncbi:MAG: tRNA pseudouridine(38-40) synthase TruA [Syntrophomonadaceae bacterium]